MGSEGISRIAPPLSWAVQPTRERPAPEPPAPGPIVVPGYADYLADRAAERDFERFTYADLLRARGIATANAQRRAEAEMNPALAASGACDNRRPRSAPPVAGGEESTAPLARVAATAAFRRLVEAVDNRGSLIDILL